MKPILSGALAGLVATVPMSILMLALKRQLPSSERHPLPPRHITAQVTQRLGLAHHMGEPEHKTATGISHFGYGAGAGALYAPLAGRLCGPPAVKGGLFGLMVWGVSYLGLMPAVGLFPSATEESPRRNGLMIAAHLVWGVTLGVLTEKLQDKPAAGENQGEE